MFGPIKRLKALSEKTDKAFKEAEEKDKDSPIDDGKPKKSEDDANAAVDAAEAVVEVAKRAVLNAIADRKGTDR
ncbi:MULTISPECIES: hypothetical protein [Sphingomonadales]|uniref:Uncharacterized protein n=2 Tax=Edaphosphingomonas TaxID=3423724 RepID=A0A2T4HMY7_9SPHN|nr:MULTISPECIES: hypothetical protein [Sphingomonas]AGH51350.1 hypothetical protein G432_18160 [Sphingomonas sp. MM-1]MDX3884008.1 hypothetical protein [Sphingomonas sp.]OHT19882.1 hypothetical protein BHE75_01875 [Sphingomonas haloaromaticamans]PTD17138.1 hypothetical protein CV103_19280 [Sphingomonas fennica]